MPRVINIRNAPGHFRYDPEYVFIGRPRAGFNGYFGNPIKLLPNEERGATLARYRVYLASRLLTDLEFRKRVIDLHDKTLVCYCKPNPCHGDVLAEACQSYRDKRAFGRLVVLGPVDETQFRHHFMLDSYHLDLLQADSAEQINFQTADAIITTTDFQKKVKVSPLHAEYMAILPQKKRILKL